LIVTVVTFTNVLLIVENVRFDFRIPVECRTLPLPPVSAWLLTAPVIRSPATITRRRMMPTVLFCLSVREEEPYPYHPASSESGNGCTGEDTRDKPHRGECILLSGCRLDRYDP
jgi:hypothetical protein